MNPANGRVLGQLPLAEPEDLDAAVSSASKAFEAWKQVPAVTRATVLNRAAAILRDRIEEFALGITLDEGKPLSESRNEVLRSAEHLEWHAEEARRIYGRVIPGREVTVHQFVTREPVGVVAAFSPWNFPLSQAIRKIAAALASGCTMVIKGPEDAPSALCLLGKAMLDAGLPAGCLNIVWGDPALVSTHLIESPAVRKISFTGSARVGKQVAAHAVSLMKRITMELGGHAPVMVFDDVDVDATARMLARFKFRNAGQVCVAPSRFFVQHRIFDSFLESFIDEVSRIRVGNGLAPDTDMGPLAQQRRVPMMERLVHDALTCGGKLHSTHPERARDEGAFFMPTVLSGVPDNALVMTEEPFGPVAPIVSFDDFDEVIKRANGVPYGLAAYVFTQAASTAHKASREIRAGLVNVNHFGGGMPETPFGGVGDSGIGSEGGSETFDGYLVTKFVTMK